MRKNWQTMKPRPSGPISGVLPCPPSTRSSLFILYFDSRNVLGTGWTAWSIAEFTTFLACFAKLADKSSKAAKLFNAVHKAQVS